NAVERRTEVADGQQAADARITKLPPGAYDAVHRAVAVLRILRLDLVPGGAIVDRQRADCPPSDLSGHPGAELRVSDAAGKEQIDRSLEVPGVLQEEGTLFRKKHLESLIDGDLRFVRFHLAEIRVQREIKRQRIA